ncbi:neural/ectodermal development factor IMP-L2-like [Aricia agestis]|uniref:neural/ectodermal development factor IMP-L2-like n=1 Tax=Aricia agestis TaxID=91739 RepID=UPI001C2030B8|nr:neural/ectodermal development factor IMP-L2-like [Aricia agestis]
MLSIVSLFAATALLQCIASGHIIKDTKRDLDNQLSPHVAPPPRRSKLHMFVRVPEPITLSRSPLGVVATCHAAGNPAPNVMWMKNGIPVADYEEQTNEIRSVSPDSVAMVTSRLVVAAVSGDVLTCVAVAGLKDTSRSEMYDEDGDYDTLPAPIITESYSDVFQQMGTSLTLPCRVASAGRYEVDWWVNDERVYGNPRLRVLPSGDLRINNLVFADLGNYTCTVRDGFGQTSESTFLYPVKPSN